MAPLQQLARYGMADPVPPPASSAAKRRKLLHVPRNGDIGSPRSPGDTNAYLNFGRLTETLIVMASVPFALVGGVWLMFLTGSNMSVAVAVGFIALAGVSAETGVIMLIYLNHALADARAAHKRACDIISDFRM